MALVVLLTFVLPVPVGAHEMVSAPSATIAVCVIDNGAGSPTDTHDDALLDHLAVHCHQVVQAHSVVATVLIIGRIQGYALQSQTLHLSSSTHLPFKPPRA